MWERRGGKKNQRRFVMNEERVKESITADVRENIRRDGIRGMKEWQSEKVEEAEEEGTIGRRFRSGKQEKTEGG